MPLQISDSLIIWLTISFCPSYKRRSEQRVIIAFRTGAVIVLTSLAIQGHAFSQTEKTEAPEVRVDMWEDASPRLASQSNFPAGLAPDSLTPLDLADPWNDPAPPPIGEAPPQVDTPTVSDIRDTSPSATAATESSEAPVVQLNPPADTTLEVVTPGLFETPVFTYPSESRLASLTGAFPSNALLQAPAGGEEPYNLRLGPARVRLGAGIGIEGNDNIHYSQSGAQADIILTPAIHLTALWQITKMNTLGVDIGLSAEEYLFHPRQSTEQLSISPSEFAFAFTIGGVHVNLHDAISLVQNPGTESTASNVTSLNLFSNEAGVTASCNVQNVTLSAGYDHTNMEDFSSSAQNAGVAPYPDQSIDEIMVSASVPVSKTVTAGLEGNFDDSETSGSQSDTAHQFTLDCFLDGSLTHFISVRASGGFQEVSIRQTQPAAWETSLDYYADISFVHRMDSVCTETLEIGHGLTGGLTTTTDDRNYVDYLIAWKVIRSVSLSTSVFAEEVTTLPDVDSEHLRRVGEALSLSYLINRQVTVNAQYQHIHKSSSLNGNGYNQNSLLMDFIYQF